MSLLKDTLFRHDPVVSSPHVDNERSTSGTIIEITTIDTMITTDTTDTTDIIDTTMKPTDGITDSSMSTTAQSQNGQLARNDIRSIWLLILCFVTCFVIVNFFGFSLTL